MMCSWSTLKLFLTLFVLHAYCVNAQQRKVFMHLINKYNIIYCIYVFFYLLYNNLLCFFSTFYSYKSLFIMNHCVQIV